MNKIIFAFAFMIALGAVSVEAVHDHNDNNMYGSYYHAGSGYANSSSYPANQYQRYNNPYTRYQHPEEGHYHHLNAERERYTPWYHTHDGDHHFHDISNGHTAHTSPYGSYTSYRQTTNSRYRVTENDCDHKKTVYGQKYPGRPNMSYTRKSTTSCGCDKNTRRTY